MPAATQALLLGSLLPSASPPACSPAGTAQLQGVGVQGDALDQLSQQQEQQQRQPPHATAALQPPQPLRAGELAAGSSAAATAGEGDALDAMMR